MTGEPPKLVVIADDYDDIAETLALLVRYSSGFRAVHVKDGAQALSEVRRRKPDACVLDIDMPNVGGMEAAQTLHDEFGENRPLLIAMSGRSLDQARKSGLFDHAMLKPIHLPDLLQMLRSA